MASDADVAGRDEVHNRSTGIAPSLTLGLGTPTRLTVQSQHVRMRNRPDGGVSTVGLEGYPNIVIGDEGVDASPVDSSNFYGSKSDYEHTDADMLTVRVEHDFGKSLRLVNTARLGRAKVDRLLTSPNALDAPTSTDTSTWTVTRRRHSNLQSNTILANQTALQG
jgi:catecholate siderophore receptor